MVCSVRTWELKWKYGQSTKQVLILWKVFRSQIIRSQMTGFLIHSWAFTQSKLIIVQNKWIYKFEYNSSYFYNKMSFNESSHCSNPPSTWPSLHLSYSEAIKEFWPFAEEAFRSLTTNNILDFIRKLWRMQLCFKCVWIIQTRLVRNNYSRVQPAFAGQSQTSIFGLKWSPPGQGISQIRPWWHW